MIKVLIGDALERLRTLDDGSVHCVVTSPPYWGLRDYSRCGCSHARLRGETGAGDVSGNYPIIAPNPLCPICHGTGLIDGVKEHQLGLEKTPEEYITKMVEIFREVKRILRSDGTMWLNMGDCYAGGAGGYDPKYETDEWKDQKHGFIRQDGGNYREKRAWTKHSTLKPKDLVGMPWRLAFALQNDGWYLRSDIIWSKPNPMPESVRDRPTKSHEYIFLLTKNARYFYDQEAMREKGTTPYRSTDFIPKSKRDSVRQSGASGASWNNRTDEERYGRNTRSVWEMPTQPYSEAHFATFPEELPRRCIKAGTSEKGCCAECGAPWERIVEPTEEYKKTLEFVKSREGQESLRSTSMQRFRNDGVLPKGVSRSAQYKTISWRPTCQCDAEVVPCVVLDPFAGSGTTGLVARSLGRKVILIELNPQYGKLIKQRAMSNVPDICEAFT